MDLESAGGVIAVAEVFSIIIWLKESGVIPLEEAQVKVDASELPEGHRSFVFNPPALPRIHFAHYAECEQAETALRKICEDIDAGKTTIMKCRNNTFVIPAHSIHYVVLGKSEAKRVNPYADTTDPRPESLREKKETRSEQRSAREVLDDHLWQSKYGTLEESLKRNFAEDVVILTGHGVFRGHDGMRECIRQLQSELPDAQFKYHTILVERDTGFLKWTAQGASHCVPDGADSYVIRDGKIVAQTIHYTVKEGEETVGGL